MSMFNKIKNKIWSKPIIQKNYESWKAKGYNTEPLVSFIIQSHNKTQNVCFLIDKLRKYPKGEIIVIDDGSDLKDVKRIASNLGNANEFLIRCNDLYEVITYDRAIYFSRGKYVILMQDDDDFEGFDWIDEGIKHFRKDEKLVILGGRDSGQFLPYDISNDGKRGDFKIDNNIMSRANSFKIKLSSKMNNYSDFEYVHYVDRAPMWVNRNIFIEKLKNIDVNFAPFQWDDAEICLRAWNFGLHVGYYNANFKLGSLGLGGMQMWNNQLHHRQDEVNVKRIYDLYSNSFDEIEIKVLNCNKNKI